jgi:hypothetical protein
MNRHPLLTLALTAGLGIGAQAEQNPYYIGASLSVQHDSNLLRLGDGQSAPAGFSAGDTILSTTVLAGFDQPISRQRVFGNVSASHNALSNNTLFNNDSYALATGLDWATVDNLSGKLHFNADRNLARFNADQVGLVTVKNIQSTRQFDATVKLGGVGRISFDAGFNNRSVDYSADAYKPRQFRQDSLSAGAHYLPSPDAVFGLGLRRTNNRYPLFFDDGNGVRSADRFHRDSIDIDASLQVSAASNFYGKLSPGRTRYDLASQRDYSNLSGLLKYNWRPTAKLRFEAALERAPSQDSYFQNYFDFNTLSVQTTTLEFSRVSNSARLRADYEFSSKLNFNATLANAHRSLTQTVDVNGAVSSGSDTSTSLTLGGSWTPLRWLLVGCSLGNERRRGGAPLSSSLSDTTASCYAQGSLQ